MFCFLKQPEYKCKIILLDKREIHKTYKGSLKGHHILADAVKFSNLCENDYFGLRYYDIESQVQWLDLNEPIKAQFNSLDTITLYFNVKYYVPDPCQLKSEVTRYLFYMQLRQDIFNGRLPVQFDEAAKLFGYMLQGELGNYDSNRDTNGYASEYEFIKNQNEELENKAQSYHKKMKNMSVVLAELNFLNMAKWLDMYGADLHPVRSESNVEYFIGVTQTGISIYQNKEKIDGYFWPRIDKIKYKNTKFYFKTISDSGSKTHVFYVKTKSACKHLWQCCHDQLMFFKSKTFNPKESQIDSPKNGVSLKYRSSIRSLNQYSSSIEQTDTFKRLPTGRNQRRQSIQSEEAIVIDENLNSSINLQKNDDSLCGSQRSLTRNEWKEIEKQGGMFSSGNNKSPNASNRSINSYQYPNPDQRRESSSGSEFSVGAKKKHRRHSRNRSEDVNSSRNSRHHRKHRSTSGERSKDRMITAEPHYNEIFVHEEPRIVKSKSAISTLNGVVNETCHETSLDETDINEIEKRRQKRRRRRSKSPNAGKPPEEMLKHIQYNIIQSSGFSVEQLREIPFVRVETEAPPFRISPHQKHRKYSPHRRKSQQDLYDSKSSLAYMKDGNSQVLRKPNENANSGMITTVTENKRVNEAIIKVNKINMNNLNDSNNKKGDHDSGCDETTSMIPRQN